MAVTILSHNVFWFQGVPYTGDQPPAPDKTIVARLSDLYRARGADLLCLQEVQSRHAFDLLARTLDMDGAWSPGVTRPAYGGAVLWRKGRARLLSDARRAGTPIERMRQCIEILDGERPLRVCNLHLPSGRQLGPERSAAQRLAEIRDALDCVEGGPDVLAGDFNEQPGGALDAWLSEHGYADAAVLTRRAHLPTSIGERRGDFLRIKSSAADTLQHYEVLPKQALAITECDSGEKTFLSDHLPLWIKLDATANSPFKGS